MGGLVKGGMQIIQKAISISITTLATPYHTLRYSFNEYNDEDGWRFKSLDEAKECLIAEFNEYVARNLDWVDNVE